MHAVFHATAHIQTPLYNLCVFLCTIPCPYFTGCQEWFHQVCIELSSVAYVAASVNIFSDFDCVPSASPLLAKNLFSTMNCSNKNLGIVKRVPKARPPLNSMSIFQKSKMMHASCHSSSANSPTNFYSPTQRSSPSKIQVVLLVAHLQLTLNMTGVPPLHAIQYALPSWKTWIQTYDNKIQRPTYAYSDANSGLHTHDMEKHQALKLWCAAHVRK